MKERSLEEVRRDLRSRWRAKLEASIAPMAEADPRTPATAKRPKSVIRIPPRRPTRTWLPRPNGGKSPAIAGKFVKT
jgi:hypothetical protein